MPAQSKKVKVVDGHEIVQKEQVVPEKQASLPTMEETLNSLEASQGDSAPKKLPTASSLHAMLAQAVHSNDAELLEKCLQIRDVNVVNATLSRLSVSHVIPLINAIVERLEQKPNRAKTLVVWIRSVLLLHTSYLISVPSVAIKLKGLYNVLENRVRTMDKLNKLNGKLDLVMSQITRESTNDAVDTAAVVYHEDDENESMADEDSDDEIIDEIEDEEISADEDEEDSFMEDGSEQGSDQDNDASDDQGSDAFESDEE